MKAQKTLGISISYINLALNTIISIFLTPYIISKLGDEGYSIYKVMQSFAGPLIMFNLGVSTIVTRAIVKYDTSDEYSLYEKQNTLALAMLASAIMVVVIAFVASFMYRMIPSIYGETFQFSAIKEGQTIFILFVASTIFHVLTDSFNGCAIGHERFVFNSSLALLKNLLRVPLIVICLYLGMDAIAITAIDCIVAFVIFLSASWYSFVILKEYPKLTHVNRQELIEMVSFSAAILLQAIVNQVNNNMDTMLLGAMVSEKVIITMYSSALLIYSVYNSIVSVMVSFFLPRATKLVTNNATGDELTDFVIKPGRYQALIAVAIVMGFALLGNEFITLWIGAKYLDAYYVVLVLIIPVTIPLVENTAISILDATLKRIFRSLVLVVMAILNVVVSVVLIKKIGFWGAALGTFFSLCIGHVFLMNWYYAKTFHMNVLRMFREIFQGILPMGLLAAVLCIPLATIGNYGIIGFLVKGVVFLFVYLLVQWKWGLREEEKKQIINSLYAIKR